MESFNLNNLFIGISVEQIIVLGVLVLISAVFGLFAGASIFFPMGYRLCKKDGLQGSAAKSAEALQPAPQPAAQPVAAPVEDTFDTNLAYTRNDLFDFVDDEEEVETETPVAAPAEEAAVLDEGVAEAAAEAEEITAAGGIVEEAAVVPALMDVAPAAEEEVIEEQGEPLRDDVFVRMEAERKALPHLVNRQEVLQYCQQGGGLNLLSNALAVSIVERDEAHPYDRLQVNGFTFAVMYEYNKVLRLVARMHPNTSTALQRVAGQYFRQDTAFGDDWYAWIVTDVERCAKNMAIVLDMSYGYSAHACFMRGKDSEFVPKIDSYEDTLQQTADAYLPAEDEAYVQAADMLNAKYDLLAFGKEEAIDYVQGLEGELAVSVETDGAQSKFKVGKYLFGVLYESYGVIKFLFRADKAYVELLKSDHPHVGLYRAPGTKVSQWYYAIWDDTFSAEQRTQLLSTAYNYVLSTGKE